MFLGCSDGAGSRCSRGKDGGGEEICDGGRVKQLNDMLGCVIININDTALKCFLIMISPHFSLQWMINMEVLGCSEYICQ